MVAMLGLAIVIAMGAGQVRAYEAIELPSVRLRQVSARLALSNRGDLLAIADSHGIHVKDTATGKLVKEWEAHVTANEKGPGSYCNITAIVFLKDGKRLISAGRDGRICVWEIATGDKLKTIQEPWLYGPENLRQRVPFDALAVSPDETRAATAIGAAVHIWDLTSGRHVAQLGWKYRTESIAAERLSAFDQAATNVGASETVTLWRLNGGAGFYSIAFSSDGKRIVANGAHEVFVWNIEREQCVLELQGAYNAVLLEKNRLAARLSETAVTAEWDIAKQQRWDIEEHPHVEIMFEGGEPIGTSEDGNLLATVLDDHVLLWDVSTRQQLFRSDRHARIELAACSKDCVTFVVSRKDSTTARLWRLVEASPGK